MLCIKKLQQISIATSLSTTPRSKTNYVESAVA